MTATMEQTQSDLPRLVDLVQRGNLVQRGEEVVITSHGRAVAKLSSIPQTAQPSNRQAWLTQLAELREMLSTGKSGTPVEQILTEDRGA